MAGKKVFRLKGKIVSQKTVMDLKGKKSAFLFENEGGVCCRSSVCYSVNTNEQIICTNNKPWFSVTECL